MYTKAPNLANIEVPTSYEWKLMNPSNNGLCVDFPKRGESYKS